MDPQYRNQNHRSFIFSRWPSMSSTLDSLVLCGHPAKPEVLSKKLILNLAPAESYILVLFQVCMINSSHDIANNTIVKKWCFLVILNMSFTVPNKNDRHAKTLYIILISCKNIIHDIEGPLWRHIWPWPLFLTLKVMIGNYLGWSYVSTKVKPKL